MTGVGAARRPRSRRAWLRLLWCLGIAARSCCSSPRSPSRPRPPSRCRRRGRSPPSRTGLPDAGTRSALPAALPAVLPAEEQADKLLTEFSVDTDGSVVVTETITWRFPEGEERHGILRNVKVRAGYQDSDTQYRYYELTGVSVTSPSGAPTDISISDFGAFRQIRIGSPSQTVSGTADYVVRYRLAHVVNDIGDGTAEFYYNVVDPSNGFPQQQVSATVTGPVRGDAGRVLLRRPRLHDPVRGGRPARPAPSPSPTSRPSRAPACSPPTPATPSAT